MGIYKNLIGSLMVAIGIFISWSWTLPSYQTASALKDVVVEKEIEYLGKRETVDKIKNWASQYNQRILDIQRFEKIIPDKKYIDEIIISIEKMTSESGLQLSDVRISDVQQVENSNYEKISLDMTLAGTYSSLATILEQIEHNIRLMDIISLSVAEQSSSVTLTGSSLLILELKLEVYVAKSVIIPDRRSINNQQ